MTSDLWQRAETDLRLGLTSGPLDKLVWEHSARVARIADAIINLPELADRALDRRALTAAALYHDIGWVLQLRAGEAIPRDLLLRPTCEMQRELGAVWLSEHVRELLPVRTLEIASNAIRNCNDRQTSATEAQILADAENLDDVGPQAIQLMIRRQMADGKTLADLVQSWQRQEEYHYWQARIKDSFHFEPVRQIAARRWQALRRFMSELAVCVNVEDIDCLQSSLPLCDQDTVPASSAAWLTGAV